MFGITYFLCILAGAFSGLMSGLFGIGGGIVVVPALLFIFDHQMGLSASLSMPMAAGTSLAVMIFTAMVAIFSHAVRQGILWDVYWKLFPMIVLGTMAGSFFAGIVPVIFLKWLLALILLFVGIRTIYEPTIETHYHFPNIWIHRTISFLIGLKSGLLGIGGGVLIVPYLTWCGVARRKISAIAALCTLTIAVIGTLMFMGLGIISRRNSLGSLGYIDTHMVLLIALPSMFCAPVGVWLSEYLPLTYVRYGFVGLIVLTVINLI